MAQNEPRKLAIRSLVQRPAETVLLVIGIALGIGTTAGGIAMVSNLRNEGRDLVESTAYREIVVSTRENATDMEVPAYRNESDEAVVLTGADLEARNSAPDVQYAYTASFRRVRISNFEAQMQQFRNMAPGGQAPPPGEAPPEEGQAGTTNGESRTDQGEQEVASKQTETAEDAGSAAEEGDENKADRQNTLTVTTSEAGATVNLANNAERQNAAQGRDRAQPGAQGQFNFNFEIPEYEGPTPILEEIGAAQITPELFAAYDIQPAQGSLFTQQEIDAGRPVAVVGSALAVGLFEDGVSLGREILVNRRLYEIIGIAEETGTDYDNYAYYPSYTAGGDAASAAIARFRGFGTALRFTVYEAERLDEAQAQLQSYFDTLYGSGAVVVRTPGTEAKETLDRNASLVTIIMFIAIAGLLIAAVNVSNILYGRAMRKRKSVGILKALGATQQEVFKLFLGEAVAIGVLGAILGIGVSVIFTRLLGDAYAASSFITGPMIAGALGALVITMGLTIVPAIQASSIPAAEALRYE